MKCYLAVLPCLVLFPLAIILSGCGSSGGAASLSPDASASAAMTAYDQDSDGQLSSEELTACPGIACALVHFDKNSDGAVSADEIAERIRAMQTLSRDHTFFICTVTHNGQPLPDADIRFVPDGFQGDAIIPAVGRTDESGHATMLVDNPDMAKQKRLNFGVHCGVYNVEITHASQKIPACYNTDTTLGVYVALDTDRSGESATFHLTQGK